MPAAAGEHNPDLACRWQGSKYLSHCRLPPRAGISRKLEWKWSCVLNLVSLMWDAGIAGGVQMCALDVVQFTVIL